MSLFPTGTSANGHGIAERDAPFEADGQLVRPIRGQIYLIDEEDLDTRPHNGLRSPPSGLVSRH